MPCARQEVFLAVAPSGLGQLGLPRCLVEPFVVGVEGGDGGIEDCELADGAVSAVGLDEDGVAGFDGVAVAIEFNFAVAFEDIVNFGVVFVVMGAGVDRDGDEVGGGGLVGVFGESASGLAAGAGDGRDIGEVGEVVAGVWHDISGDLGLRAVGNSQRSLIRQHCV